MEKFCASLLEAKCESSYIALFLYEGPGIWKNSELSPHVGSWIRKNEAQGEIVNMLESDLFRYAREEGDN